MDRDGFAGLTRLGRRSSFGSYPFLPEVLLLLHPPRDESAEPSSEHNSDDDTGKDIMTLQCSVQSRTYSAYRKKETDQLATFRLPDITVDHSILYRMPMQRLSLKVVEEALTSIRNRSVIRFQIFSEGINCRLRRLLE
jgi:hypothetical protein